MNIFTDNFFLAELIFLKGHANIYFEYITLFEKKKKFTEKNKIFLKIIHIIFLKNIIFISNSFATFEQSYSTNKTFDCSLFQRLKRRVLVSEESFIKTKRSLSFEIGRYLLAFHED